MKKWINVPCDLYVSKDDIEKMEEGDSGIGYITVNESNIDEYELINKHAFQPVREDRVIDSNTFEVVFHCK